MAKRPIAVVRDPPFPIAVEDMETCSQTVAKFQTDKLFGIDIFGSSFAPPPYIYSAPCLDAARSLASYILGKRLISRGKGSG